MKTDKMTRTKLVQGREISINSWPGKEERNKTSRTPCEFFEQKIMTTLGRPQNRLASYYIKATEDKNITGRTNCETYEEKTVTKTVHKKKK